MNSRRVLYRLVILALLAVWGAAQPLEDAEQPAEPDSQTDPNLLHSPWRQQIGSLMSFKGKEPTEPQFCVVVRTYWGHSAGHTMGLRRLIRSLQRQTVKRWEAIFLVMDDKPFMDLHHILREFNDDRLWVFAEWVGTQFMPKNPESNTGEWMPGYHGMLYNLTDDAIQVCPRDTRWLMVTNGDNEYAENYMQKVVEAGDTDIVAFDFYSRFQRITAPPCERFGAWSDRPSCKRNRLKWCHTDLGANVINYPKFLTEQRRFGTLKGSDMGLQEDHYDGIMAQVLLDAGWRTHIYEGQCLFSHAPNPQWCGWQGGVWDDIDIISWQTAGGRCIGWEEREKILAEDPTVEEVLVTLSRDWNVSVFEGVEDSQLEIRCLRKRDYLAEQLRAMEWYSLWCTEDADIPIFEMLQQAYLPHLSQPAAPADGIDAYSQQALHFKEELAASGMLPQQPPEAHEREEGWQPEVRQQYDPPPEQREEWEERHAEQQVLAEQAAAQQRQQAAAKQQEEQEHQAAFEGTEAR